VEWELEDERVVFYEEVLVEEDSHSVGPPGSLLGARKAGELFRALEEGPIEESEKENVELHEETPSFSGESCIRWPYHAANYDADESVPADEAVFVNTPFPSSKPFLHKKPFDVGSGAGPYACGGPLSSSESSLSHPGPALLVRRAGPCLDSRLRVPDFSRATEHANDNAERSLPSSLSAQLGDHMDFRNRYHSGPPQPQFAKQPPASAGWLSPASGDHLANVFSPGSRAPRTQLPPGSARALCGALLFSGSLPVDPEEAGSEEENVVVELRSVSGQTLFRDTFEQLGPMIAAVTNFLDVASFRKLEEDPKSQWPIDNPTAHTSELRDVFHILSVFNGTPPIPRRADAEESESRGACPCPPQNPNNWTAGPRDAPGEETDGGRLPRGAPRRVRNFFMQSRRQASRERSGVVQGSPSAAAPIGRRRNLGVQRARPRQEDHGQLRECLVRKAGCETPDLPPWARRPRAALALGSDYVSLRLATGPKTLGELVGQLVGKSRENFAEERPPEPALLPFTLIWLPRRFRLELMSGLAFRQRPKHSLRMVVTAVTKMHEIEDFVLRSDRAPALNFSREDRSLRAVTVDVNTGHVVHEEALKSAYYSERVNCLFDGIDGTSSKRANQTNTAFPSTGTGASSSSDYPAILPGQVPSPGGSPRRLLRPREALAAENECCTETIRTEVRALSCDVDNPSGDPKNADSVEGWSVQLPVAHLLQALFRREEKGRPGLIRVRFARQGPLWIKLAGADDLNHPFYGGAEV